MPIRILNRPALQSIAAPRTPPPTLVPEMVMQQAPGRIIGEDGILSSVAAMPLSPNCNPPPNFPTPKPRTSEKLMRALDDHWQEKRVDDLYLVSIETSKMYLVEWYDGETGKVRLLSASGLELTPSVSDREESKYYPAWYPKLKKS